MTEAKLPRLVPPQRVCNVAAAAAHNTTAAGGRAVRHTGCIGDWRGATITATVGNAAVAHASSIQLRNNLRYTNTTSVHKVVVSQGHSGKPCAACVV